MKKIILFLWFMLIFSSCSIWWEIEWVINEDFLDSCNETIKISDWFQLFKTFTCTYEKTKNWNIQWWICVNLKTSEDWKICKKAYIYQKTPYMICWDNSRLTYNEECECVESYVKDEKNICTNWNMYCEKIQNWRWRYSFLNWKCECDDIYLNVWWICMTEDEKYKKECKDLYWNDNKCLTKNEKCIEKHWEWSFFIKDLLNSEWCWCSNWYVMEFSNWDHKCIKLNNITWEEYCTKKNWNRKWFTRWDQWFCECKKWYIMSEWAPTTCFTPEEWCEWNWTNYESSIHWRCEGVIPFLMR